MGGRRVRLQVHRCAVNRVLSERTLERFPASECKLRVHKLLIGVSVSVSEINAVSRAGSQINEHSSVLASSAAFNTIARVIIALTSNHRLDP